MTAPSTVNFTYRQQAILTVTSSTTVPTDVYNSGSDAIKAWLNGHPEVLGQVGDNIESIEYSNVIMGSANPT